MTGATRSGGAWMVGSVVALALASATGAAPSFAGAGTAVVAGDAVAYEVIGEAPRVNRRVLGPVTHRVAGVPARPVDGFVWDGVGSTPVEGEIVIEIDPVHDAGAVLARWVDEHGEWEYRQALFQHPHHAAGVRIGPSVSEVATLIKDPVVANVYLHGDTNAGAPVLPTVFAYVAAWGPAEVTLDGVPFASPFEIPAPLWLGHLMVTEGIRGNDGAVRTRDGAVFDPSRASEGRTEPGDLEVHLVFHDERFPLVPENVPPLYDFFYHLVFENVGIRMIEADFGKDVVGPAGDVER